MIPVSEVAVLNYEAAFGKKDAYWLTPAVNGPAVTYVIVEEEVNVFRLTRRW